MFNSMKPLVYLVNAASFFWFGALQFYRFKDSGRACSGDFNSDLPILPFISKISDFKKINSTSAFINQKPPSYLLTDTGFWFLVYIIA